MKMNRSKLFMLNLRDGVHGLLMAVVGAVGQLIVESQISLPLGGDQIHRIETTAFIAGVGYLMKKLFTNSNGELKGEAK
jgi:hypothetical protein